MVVSTALIEGKLRHSLNDELREFSKTMPVVIEHPSLEAAQTAISPHFPDLLDRYHGAQELLDRVGIVVLIHIGHGIQDTWISWSVADTKESALEQVVKYSQSTYCEIRKALGIQYHWVVKVRPDFWGYDDNTIVERYGGFAQLPTKPECWILDLG